MTLNSDFKGMPLFEFDVEYLTNGSFLFVHWGVWGEQQPPFFYFWTPAVSLDAWLLQSSNRSDMWRIELCRRQ